MREFVRDLFLFYTWLNNYELKVRAPYKKRWYKKGNEYTTVEGVSLCYIYPKQTKR